MAKDRRRSPGEKLRDVMERGTVVLPGAFNALTALQIERAGFQALYVSGAGLSAARGLPDLGLLSMAEVVADAAAIARAVSIPAIVDIDTGYGPPLVVMRTVEECERAGLAGIQIEDQDLPKQCGHLPGKRLVSLDEMASKIRAACHARCDPTFVIVARTDARAVEGLEGAIKRARSYVEAGADVIFPEALESAEEFRLFAEGLAGERGTAPKVPLLANMTEFGKTPYLSVAEFESLGYRLVLFPVTALRVAAKAVELLLAELKRQGSQRHLVERMQTRHELYDLLRYEDYERRSRLCEAKEEGHADH